jgi:uncharacterized protein (DUF697 family)
MENPKSPPARPKISRSRHRLYQASDSVPALESVETATISATAAETTSSELSAQLSDSPSVAYRLAKARRRVDYYSALAGTVGVLPVPVMDMLAVGGLQLKLIHELSRIYDIPFSGQRAKASVAALIGGAQTGLMIKGLFKYIPVYGYVIMAIPAAFAASTLTYAIGRVFVHHFELGGTLLDFDATRLRGYFREQLQRKGHATRK